MKVYIIAEIGINHNGDLGLAKCLMQHAKAAGANAVKFQKRTIEAVYTPEELAKPRLSPWGTTNGELKRKLEFTRADYDEIAAYAASLGLDWFASAWDPASIRFLSDYRPPYLKIPSALLTNDPLLTAYRETGIPLILSTGMSTVEEIDHAVSLLTDDLKDADSLTLLHCTSAYPCALEEVNLLAIPTLRGRYGLPVGFSSHTKAFWPCLGAVALGATMVEAHVTLDHTLFGTDQAASIEPEGFKKLCLEIRDLETCLGDGQKRIYPSEVPIREKLRRG